MGDIKWIKITTDIFDDEKILLIESLPEADSIIVIWFKLLCFAGKMNNSGVFIMNNKVAYTDKMLATIFRRKEATVKLALETFQHFGMIEIVDDVITIPNWGKHQNLDQLENKKEYMRDYMREYREKQKKIVCKTNSKSNSKTNVSSLEGEEDKDREEEIEKEIIKTSSESNESIPYQDIVDMYHKICVSYPKIRGVSENRKKAIKARLKKWSLEDIREAFTKAERSDFMKGANARNWSADFDWMMNDANLTKILEGKYDNSPSQSQPKQQAQTKSGYSQEMLDRLINERREDIV